MSAVRASTTRGAAPVERWNPPDCGEIDIAIDGEGRWSYRSSPIERVGLVKLFASVLRKDGERYVLVTPVEKLGIRVEDVPFLAVDMASETTGQGEQLVFRTSLDDLVRCDGEHPLRFAVDAGNGGLKPYIRVRGELWARLSRSVTLELVEHAEERIVDGVARIGVASAGSFFPIDPAA
ncbi:DUF1285 domain-containing protein [Ancylobacter sp. 6x-1]|uniref:DUF1285 domain-containing protein n=1 Tax=Ancylobacter crimeensis TaxID=2579147 RepID=A0ABT0D9N5_9HYPH|nr:DUF1285 domain-containing protein [Ancylobacter crimeensis]MCK0196657.1 DUF1285 domain-containing protein [Ancylobacter crimeensis]